MKYYDIYLTVFFGGYETDAIKRIIATDEHDAIKKAFQDETRTLDEGEVAALLSGAEQDMSKYHIEDGDTGIRFDEAVELFEAHAVVNGQNVIALLPDPKQAGGIRYFKP